MPAASIIIPHYNDPTVIEPCLTSLQKLSQKSPDNEIVVVDDASTDDSVMRIRKDHPRVRVVESQENRGFIGAIEAGVEGTDSEILVFLNNDTWVEPDWLVNLADPILSGEVNGASGSVILDWEGKATLFQGGSLNYLGFGFEDRGLEPDPASRPIPQLFVCGAAMAVSRKLYRECGGFDPEFGMIYEDVDFGWRLNLLGYECFVMPASRIGHRGHASLGRAPYETKAKHYIGNSIRTVFKNWDPEHHLERMEMVVSLAEARERVTLLGEDLRRGGFRGFKKMFGMTTTTPIVGNLVRKEEETRSLAKKRQAILTNRKRTSTDLFERFVAYPTRPWFFDECQNRFLEERGYWELERETYRRFGLI